MPLQHYLPATFLATFSMENTLPRRNRTLAAGDKNSKRIFLAKASKLAGINDLYPPIVDESLTGYEANLSTAIDQLLNQNLTAMAWTSTLVPFVTALFVRGPDFNTRFDSRIKGLGIEAPPGNTDYARLMEYQRMLAPVATARWLVLEIQSDYPMITSGSFGMIAAISGVC
jgi:hypothetical protein